MEEIQPNKPSWESKTLWFALINALIAFFPEAREWVATNPEIYMPILSGAFIVLRLLTKGRLSIK